MVRLEVEGKHRLFGEVTISGSKNSALPIIASSMISRSKVTLNNVPKIQDIFDLLEIMKDFNVKWEFNNNSLFIDSSDIVYSDLTNSKVSKIRGSYYLMSTSLVLFQKVLMCQTGGCKIGERPIDLHLEAFKAMGCEIVEGKDLCISYNQLNNTTIKFKKKSVGATINALILSYDCDRLELRNASIEPEIVDFINFMEKLGRKFIIKKNTIISMKKDVIVQNDIVHRIIPDRIEAATYMVIGALCGGVKVSKVNIKHLKNVIYPFKKLGIGMRIKKDSIYVYKRKINKFDIFVKEYPGFSTDIQPLFCPLLCFGKKSSIVVDFIFKERFKVCEELNKMGARNTMEKNGVLIKPVKKLSGTTVIASDLRCAAGLLIAGLASDGITIIEQAEYLNRGYEDVIGKLQRLGAKIKIC